jgi:hypothetical protein
VSKKVARLEKCGHECGAYHANRLQPDFVVMLGDMINGKTKEFDLGELRDYAKGSDIQS